MHAFAVAYGWLVDNKLWQAVVGWTVALILGYVVGRVPWKRHRLSQMKVEDSLDTTTPGGLQVVTSLVERQNELLAALTQRQVGNEADPPGRQQGVATGPVPTEAGDGGR